MDGTHVSTHKPVAGRYRLVEVLHRETHHISWYADDLATDRPCLVTQVTLPGSPDGDKPYASARARLPSHVLRTTGTVARLCPGRIAAVLDSVDENDFLWTATTWVEGVPLGKLLSEQGSLSIVQAARIGLELLDVLDAAHGAGVIHGELGPGQVFLRESGPAVVTGFGLAGACSVQRLTTPSHAAPEQVRGEDAGPEADLWALGALLHTMVEGHPPPHDREQPENTPSGGERPPSHTPLRAGPLTQVIQGLLREDPAERLPRQVARRALCRVLAENPVPAPAAGPIRPRLRRGHHTLLGAHDRDGSRATLLGTTLAVVAVSVVVLTAATRGLSGSGPVAGSASPPPASATAPVLPSNGSQTSGASGAPGYRGTPVPSTTAPPSPSASTAPTVPAAPVPSGTSDLPAGYHVLRAAEGFSIALPEGFERVDTSRVSDLAYRITFGSDGGARALAVTYSERVGNDPVAVWRDDVEPPLKQTAGYERIGEIRPTTYQGREAADMEWFSTDNGSRSRTFGRGFLLGGGRGFSLRWTTPAADWEDPANQRALRTFLRTFQPPSG